MTIAKVEQRRPGRPKKILDLRKLDSIKIAVPESPEQALETLLVFDARCLDKETRQELLRILPQLVHVRRAWRAEYMECGCSCCHKKSPCYGAGGYCGACYARIGRRMRSRYRKAMQGRNIPAEIEAFQDALCLSYNAAQRLFR